MESIEEKPKPVRWWSPRRVPDRWRRLLVAAGIVFLVVGACAVGGVQLLPVRYAANSVVSFTPRPQSGADANMVQLIAQKYAVVATSEEVLGITASRTGVPESRLRGAIASQVQPDTGNLTITATLPDRHRAADVANAVANAVADDASDDDIVSGEQTAQASAAAVQASPPKPLLSLAGGVAALLLAALVLLAARRLDRRNPPR